MPYQKYLGSALDTAIFAPRLTQLTRAKPRDAFVVPLLAAPASSLRLSLVIPTFNEVASLATLVDQLDCLLKAVLPGQYEIIVVDDDSPDGTARLAAQLAQQHPAVKLLHRSQERGLATAVVRGWQQAEGDFLAVMDGDLQHPPSVVLKLLEALERGATIAIASRYITVIDEGSQTGIDQSIDPDNNDLDNHDLNQNDLNQAQWQGRRRWLSGGAQQLGQWILPDLFKGLSDPLSGCFVLRREMIEGRSLHPMGYKILLEVLSRGTALSVAEVGYEFGERQRGASKASVQQAGLYLLHLLRLRWASRFQKGR